MKTVDEVASFYQDDDFDFVLLRYGIQRLREHKVGTEYLELGCSLGLSTQALLEDATRLDVVEGSLENIRRTEQRVANPLARFHHSFWEAHDYPDAAYSDVVWFRGLEHIGEPDQVLDAVRPAIRPGGRIHIIVPNALSMHRRLGVYMKLIDSPHALSERDVELGHHRVYDRFGLIQLLRKCGFAVVSWKGIIVKPLTNARMATLHAEIPNLTDALHEMADEFPDLAAELYICAEPS